MGQGACAGYQKYKPRQKECDGTYKGISSEGEDTYRSINNNNNNYYKIEVS